MYNVDNVAVADLQVLTPRQFERLAADYLVDAGYTGVVVVGGAGDLGVNVRAHDKHGRLVIAQCKRYSSGAKVGSPEIQHFFGMVVHAGAARGIFFTSSTFTRPAIALAAQRDIELVDVAKLAPLLDRTLARQPRLPLPPKRRARPFPHSMGIRRLSLAVLALLVLAAVIGSRSDEDPSVAAVPRATATKVAVALIDDLEIRVTGARMARSFPAPLSLPPMADGRHYLIVAADITNVDSEERGLDSDNFVVRVDDKKVKEAGDLIDPVAEGLGLKSMGDMFGTDVGERDRKSFAFVYKVKPAADSYVFHVTYGPDRKIDLSPYLAETGAFYTLGPPATATRIPTSTVAAGATAPPRPSTPFARATIALPTATIADTATATMTIAVPTPSLTAAAEGAGQVIPTSAATAPPLPPTAPPRPEATATWVPTVAATASPAATATSSPTATLAPPPGVSQRARRVELIRVEDGDTIFVREGGERYLVDLIAADAPELPVVGTAGDCFADKSAYRLGSLLDEAKRIWIERDSQNRGVDGNLLRYLWVEDADGQAILLNELLVRHGYAALAEDGINLRHIDQLRAAQDEAWANSRGLWVGCGGPHAALSTPTPSPEPVTRQCSAFQTYDQAQAYYYARPDAQPFLDPNYDGRACEDWFRVDIPPTPIPYPTAPPPSGGNSGGGGYTSGNRYGGNDGIDYDCRDFSTQAAAQAYFNGDGGSAYDNVDALDHNNNGIACDEYGLP